MSRSLAAVSKYAAPLFAASVVIAFATVVATEGTARADIPPPTSGMGDKGQLWIDQVSGLRISTDGSLNYYGPIGLATRSVSEDALPPAQANTSTTVHTTTFWIAPSADIFVIDHLSVGGLIQFASTSSSVDQTTGGVTVNFSQPTTTNFTLMPRVGWLFALNDKWGIWPRLGLGFVTAQSNSAQGNNFVRDSFSGFAADLDVGFIFRPTDAIFLKLAPDLSFIPGGSHSQEVNNVSTSADASAFQFSIVSGVGVIFDL